MATSASLIDRIRKHRGPITAELLLDNAQYEQHRSAVLRWARTVKAKRRLSLGTDFTILFENQVTVWTQIQEELRWVHRNPQRLKQLLHAYNDLIPPTGELRACLFMDTDKPETMKRYRTLGSLEDLNLTLCLQERQYAAKALEPSIHGVDPVSFIAFTLEDGHTLKPDQISWTRPNPGCLELPAATRVALSEELGWNQPTSPPRQQAQYFHA